MAAEHVRVCPVCETENPPARARCACGALLSGVDFSLARAPAAAASDVPAEAHPPLPAETPAEALSPGMPEGAAPIQDAASTAVCRHADCAQPNPAGTLRCVYCNRPMADDDGTLPAPPEDAQAAGFRLLPAALRGEYRIVDAFPVSGSEADILLVEHIANGERRVAKLYRRGLQPDFRLLEILSRTVGDTVVRVLAHGVSEGVAYELLEYIPGGTLHELLGSGPLPVEDVRRIVAEIADALNGIHAHRILHRDLKPENVMVRSRDPLELALTDFGIASLTDATQHFTSMARTTMYAAPEVLTGVLDEKSDWWALGMIALEAAQGRHPFAGLTEHVMGHHLATRPIEVSGVYDERLRLLCRGLLLRDPKHRWAPAEVARWLADDVTLTVADETAAGAVKPYRIGATESTTGPELALALARHWMDACRDLARGQIASWIEHELHDYNLLRSLRDIQDHREMSDDMRLLRFVLAAAPDLPPVWRGEPVSDETILAAARRAAGGDAAAEAWLDSLYRERVLPEFTTTAGAPLQELDRCWRESWTHFLELWNAARSAEAVWRRKPRPVAGYAAAKVVSYDDAMYGAQHRLSLPPQSTLNASLLLSQVDRDYVGVLRAEILAALPEIAGYCGWYEALWEQARHDPVSVLVMHRLLKYARDDAASEKRRAGVSDEARQRIMAEARAEVRDRLSDVLGLAPDDRPDADRDSASHLLDALDSLQRACVRVASLGYTEAECEELRQSSERVSAVALMLQQALARYEEIRETNAVFLQGERVLLFGAIGIGIIAIRVPWVALALVVAALIGIAYRLNLSSRAAADAATKLRLLRVQGRPFTRTPEEEPA